VAAGRYESERHPVGESVLQATDAFNNSCSVTPVRTPAAHRPVGTATRLPRAMRLIGERSAASASLPAHTGDDWMSAAGCPTSCRRQRVYELLRDGKFVLVTAAR